MDPIYALLGQALREARIAADLTQEQVARRIGLSRTSVTNMEKGRQVIAFHTFVSLASCLGVDAASLIPRSLPRTPRLVRDEKKPLEIPGLGKAETDWVARVIGKGTKDV